jgi:hypothetical protein
MNGRPCWPEWLTRRNRERFGPEYGSDVPYPVYQVQPSILSADNPNATTQGVNEAFFQGAAGRVAIANLDTTIIHVMPKNVYDTINIVCFTSPASAAGPPRLPALTGTPVFFSLDKPGRIASEVKLSASEEVFVATASVFSPTDFSSYPSCIQSPNVTPEETLTNATAIYTSFLYPTVKTNRPFYFWFGDGINGLPVAPATHVNFKVSWYVQGR